MECPKCHSIIDDNSTVCPKCHKVLLLECPNCHEIGDTQVCGKCGYTILVKCAKCSKINPAVNDLCSKCGFPTASSLACSECETDEFASVVVKFNNLNQIRRLLKSKELYNKFLNKLKNLILSYFKGLEGKVIIYKDSIYTANFNKELSFPTSCSKAVRFAIKLANAFTELNLNVIEEFKIPLALNIEIFKKKAEDLQNYANINSNVKLLVSQKNIKKYLKGTQIILDQFVRDEISKDYKTDSLYTMEENGKTVMFYEILLDSYILPPDKKVDDQAVNVKNNVIKKNVSNNIRDFSNSINIFDINAKCYFEKTDAISIKDILYNLDYNQTKIISLRSDVQYLPDMAEIVSIIEDRGYKVLKTSCNEIVNYKPWGAFSNIFRDYFNLPNIIDQKLMENINEDTYKMFKQLFEIQLQQPLLASSPEDARFAYMEKWNRFFSVLKNTVIVFDGFENLDDTSIQTLEIYFRNIKKVVPNFLFITKSDNPVHSKIKELLRTPLYTEYQLYPVEFGKCLSTIKSDASDFIESFYFDKIQENYSGSYLYFKEAVSYLKENDVLVDFDGKLIVKNSKAVILPAGLEELYKLRMKLYCKDAEPSLILGFAYVLGGEADLNTLKMLGVSNTENQVERLKNAGIVSVNNGRLFINNYNIINTVMSVAMKSDAKTYLANKTLKVLDNKLSYSAVAYIDGIKNDFKSEYLKLVENSGFAISTGDYDAYLKNCLGFLTLLDKTDQNMSAEATDNIKKEVYNNILNFLYNYAPAKIYYIENLLLLDAIEKNNDELISKLSNLMLQGALITSNYNDAQGLLYNILSRMKDASLVVDNAINTKFLLLSLVQIEIFYFTGEYRQCVDTAAEIMSVITPASLEKIKPGNFSLELFVTHLFDTFRLAAISKIIINDPDLDGYIAKIEAALGDKCPEKDVLFALRDYLSGQIYSIGDIENYSPFSKTVFLLLQEISSLKSDYKKFAQNVFQAKLLAEDIHNYELKLFCDFLIGFAYMKVGDTSKADKIFNDLFVTAKNTGMFSVKVLSNYFAALSEYQKENTETAMEFLNDNFALIRSKNNKAALFYVLNQALYIKIAKEQNISAIDIQTEESKLTSYSEAFNRLLI